MKRAFCRRGGRRVVLGVVISPRGGVGKDVVGGGFRPGESGWAGAGAFPGRERGIVLRPAVSGSVGPIFHIFYKCDKSPVAVWFPGGLRWRKHPLPKMDATPYRQFPQDRPAGGWCRRGGGGS